MKRSLLVAAGLGVMFSGCIALSAQAANLAEVQQGKVVENAQGATTVESLLNAPDTVQQNANSPDPMASSSDPMAEPPVQVESQAPVDTPTVAVAKPQAAAQKTAPPAVSKALPAITQIKMLYKQGKFRDALNIIATQKPTELTHYYAGLCYQGQGQLKQAAYEFNYVASYAKDPMVKYNATIALRSVNSYASARTYTGQGNTFARVASGGGGGSRMVRRG